LVELLCERRRGGATTDGPRVLLATIAQIGAGIGRLKLRSGAVQLTAETPGNRVYWRVQGRGGDSDQLALIGTIIAALTSSTISIPE
jgi:hypothetical protein